MDSSVSNARKGHPYAAAAAAPEDGGEGGGPAARGGAVVGSGLPHTVVNQLLSSGEKIA